MDPLTLAALSIASAAAAALPYIMPSSWFGRRSKAQAEYMQAIKAYAAKPDLDPVEAAFFERLAQAEQRRMRALEESYRRGRMSREALGAASAALLGAQAENVLARARLVGARRRERELMRLGLLEKAVGLEAQEGAVREARRAGLSRALGGVAGAGFNYYLLGS